jgi:hypothetical protein
VNTLVLVVVIIFLVFAFVILFGAPYLPTLNKRVDDAFELLDLKPGDTLLELGSGDGRVLKRAAQMGIKGVGYELNPLLVWYSQISCWRYRKLVTFKCRNYWQVTLPPADAVFVFLLDKYMAKLDKKITADMKTPVKLVSHAFKVPGKNIVRQKNALFLYLY